MARSVQVCLHAQQLGPQSHGSLQLQLRRLVQKSTGVAQGFHGPDDGRNSLLAWEASDGRNKLDFYPTRLKEPIQPATQGEDNTNPMTALQSMDVDRLCECFRNLKRESSLFLP